MEANLNIEPFLRWVGGKTWFLKHLSGFLPPIFGDYYEPFLGSGAVYFRLRKLGLLRGRAILSDANKELIDCFVQVRDNVEEVIQLLSEYPNERSFYYDMRSIAPSPGAGQAARFIYLNRTSFNGVFRVNLAGVYNVPFGNKKYRVLFDYQNLRNASILLQGTEIVNGDFAMSTQGARDTDLVFLDPPYTVSHGGNGFVKYNQKIFAWEDQRRLADTALLLNERGAYFILTNAAHPSIHTLFGDRGFCRELTRFSVVGGKRARRGCVSEYVFFNTLGKMRGK